MAFCLVVFTAPFSLNVSAEPTLAYSFTPKSQDVTLNGFSGMEEVMSDCTQRIADIVIDDVLYDDKSADRIVGFRAKETKQNRWPASFAMQSEALYLKLPNAERLVLHQIIKRGVPVIVTYQSCGSGGFNSVKDVYRKAAINK